MRATPRFLAEITGSHEPYSYATVRSPGRGPVVPLTITGGSVTVDRTATIRRQATVDVLDPDGLFAPAGPSSILGPYGAEVRLYRGVKYSDGTTETYPLGVFPVAKTDIVEQSGTRISLDLYDRSRRISRNQFTQLYQISAGTNVVSAIKQLAARTFPNLQYNAIGTTLVTAASLVWDPTSSASADPWAAMTTLATSAGCEVYFDANGWLVIAPVPDVDSHQAPVFQYVEGDGCTAAQIEVVYDDSNPGYNGVILTGQSIGTGFAPVRATAWDTDPTSPSYYLGAYGQNPTFVNDTTITDQVTAQAAADSLLRRALGTAVMVNITGVPNPAFEAAELVRVTRQALGLSGLYQIQSFTVPLASGDMQSVSLGFRRVA